MSDTELIVPVKVHALLANRTVRTLHPFWRTEPSFAYMLGDLAEDIGRGSAEPAPFDNGKVVDLDDSFEGVHVQWELPEALTEGWIDDANGETHYPLVPNRWLVVRYATVNGTTTAAGWVVHSDYLYSDDEGASWDGESVIHEFVTPDAEAAQTDWLGRAHPLTEGPWQEPTARPLFLTAVGAGTPAFAAMESYHENVFSLHDTLADLKGRTDDYPPDAQLSYLVTGWYSDEGSDLLRTAPEIPGLLPPEPADGPVDPLTRLLTGLGWTVDGDTGRVDRTLYAGTALGLVWEREGAAPEDDRPDPNLVKTAFGHSTGEVAELLIAQQTRSLDDGRLFGALFQGTLDTFDGEDGERDLAEITHTSWFAGRDGGATWQIVPRADEQTEGDAAARRTARTPGWLDRLNADQAAYDRTLRDLSAAQWRVWSLHWLHNLPAFDRPADLPADFDTECEKLLDRTKPGPAKDAADGLTALTALRARMPHLPDGDADPQEAIDDWATDQGLAAHLRLQRVPADAFHTPADPVLLIEGTGGGTVPLTRDADDPLPCRLPSNLLREVLIGGRWVSTPGNLPALPALPTEQLPQLPALLHEFALLDLAARTPEGAGTALHAIVEDPEAAARGPLAEYTAPWRQPWLPMTLMWTANHFPLPYRTGDRTNWTFGPPAPGSGLDSYSYTWDGTGALPADFESEGDVLNREYRSTSYLAPTTVHVLRAQLARYRDSYPSADRAALDALREELKDLDVLSQTLTGLGDWLRQLDGGAQLATEDAVAPLTGPQNHVPDPATAPGRHRFQPVRGGQLFLTKLRIVDRFGRCLDLVTDGEGGNWYDQYPLRTASVTPNRPLYTTPQMINPERFIQLPPRLLHDTRLAITHRPTGAAVAAGQTDGLAGWLLVNHLDRSLAVYAPDGSGLGELRAVGAPAARRTDYTALPHSPYTDQTDPRLAEDHPEVHAFLAALLAHPVEAFEALVATVDRSLRTQVATAGQDDDLPAVLIGRPVALLHATLDLELHSARPTDPSWAAALDPSEDDAAPTGPEDTWAIRLGDPYDLDDGLIGYFRAPEPGQQVDYRLLHALTPVGGSDYLTPTTNGADLALPARTPRHARTRKVTLLAHPHLPVHATTDILPVHSVRLDPERVHRSLAALRASFRLNPLLATARSQRELSTTMRADPEHPLGQVAAGEGGEFRSLGAPAIGATITLDLGAVHQLTGYSLRTGSAADNRPGPGAPVLESSATGAEDDWQSRAFDPARPDNDYVLATPVAARYLRLRTTTPATGFFALRGFDTTCAPDDAALVLPPLSSRYGSWSWAQPQATATEQLDWDEHPLIPADQLSHPDDPAPTARAGYLQLAPAALREERP
ncbi:hypothetical protein [Kitasatospora sp. NPDC094011]|uniref:hypothetical protein n=1 Tax=Kitasatospora sp. NPDC094011 TaxID=3364090 RepID=UPI003804A75B